MGLRAQTSSTNSGAGRLDSVIAASENSGSAGKAISKGNKICGSDGGNGIIQLKKLSSSEHLALQSSRNSVALPPCEMDTEMETNCITSTITTTTTNTTTTTYRTCSGTGFTAANCIRPQTLNVHNPRETATDHTHTFFGDILNAWRAKARCNVVPAERTQELFHELSFHPSEKQISEMLQTAKMLARKGCRHSNGLTFGEFCVLAADLKRFRASSYASVSLCDESSNLLGSLTRQLSNCSKSPNASVETIKVPVRSDECASKKSSSPSSGDSSAQVEVFLGGSCNPTTWRADVAIPALQELGISFYNPQVSDWTPDLIELEHRAKEKARVLFFVMDSETRASAGAIEAAHIAGQNCKQLVLVLHPYKPNQYILNEHISQQEYNDLMRNQLILKELVTRRGLPVLDDIPSGLQRTKEILAGIRDPPLNIASILIVVRGAFNRVNPVNDVITIQQCQRALLYLGYAQSLLNLENLNKIIVSQQESFDSLLKRSTKQSNNSSVAPTAEVAPSAAQTDNIDFNLFCIISAYLSVLQQEIHESGCISPIKGTNVPPPPVYLTNLQGDESFTASYYCNKNISRTSSSTSVPSNDERQSVNDLLSRSRDSGTSSPQPLDTLKTKFNVPSTSKQKTQLLVNVESIETTEITTAKSTRIHPEDIIATSQPSIGTDVHIAEEESDSNDSVFSSSSSINSVNFADSLLFSSFDYRDVYLGGSCFLRSRWRQDVAIPYLKSKNITFHLPALHESIQSTQQDPAHKVFEDDSPLSINAEEHQSVVRTHKKCRGRQVEEEKITVAEESFSWNLPMVRPNLYNPSLLDSSRVLLFVITNETRSLAPMTLAAHCIGLMYNVVLAVQMLPDNCVIGSEKLTPAAIKDYNRGRSYLIDLAKRQGVPVFTDLKAALECTIEKVKACNSRHRFD